MEIVTDHQVFDVEFIDQDVLNEYFSVDIGQAAAKG